MKSVLNDCVVQCKVAIKQDKIVIDVTLKVGYIEYIETHNEG
ncbi:hypothetical protein [Caudoviricetes sp.]|nr:hypothetical protein [Caudoviricetes sp.]